MDKEKRLQFLQEKWRVWFNLLDINRDGALSAADWNKGAEMLIKENSLSGLQAESVRDSFAKIGSKLLGNNFKEKGRVEMHELVDNLTAFYNESSVKALQYIHDAALQLFMTTDVDRNSAVSRKEFTSMCKSLGIHSDSAAVFYEDLPQWEIDRVPLQAAVNWWADLWFGTDPQVWARFKSVTSENC